MKDTGFSRFFNPQKSMSKEGSGIHQRKKLKSHTVWNSKVKGPYIREIHGDLK